jgi:hypothetical protein
VYNETNISLLEGRPEVVWDTTFSMTSDHIYDAFYLKALMLDRKASGGQLEMSNSATSQAERLRPLLQERNARFQGPGRPEWDHCCDLCSIRSTKAIPSSGGGQIKAGKPIKYRNHGRLTSYRLDPIIRH